MSELARSKGKKVAPDYVVRLGLSVPYVCMHCYVNVINHVNMMGLRAPYICRSCHEMVLCHGTCDNRPKGVEINICAQGAAQPLVAEAAYLSLSSVKMVGVSEYNTGGGLSEPKTVG